MAADEKKKKKMSVAEILAACRKMDSGQKSESEGGSGAASEPSAAAASESQSPQGEASQEAAQPASASKPAKPSSGKRPSVQEILAMARAEKQKKAAGGTEKAAAAAEKPAAKPAAKKPAAKPTAKPKPAPATAEEKPHSSNILAGEETPKKRGPVPKSVLEAARRPARPKEEQPAKTAKAKPVVPPRPTRPPSAKAKAKPDQQRRGFLAVLGAMVATPLGVGFSSLATTMGLWTLGTLRFLFPNVRIEPPSKFKVGSPADYPPGYVETKYKTQYAIWIVNAEYKGQQQIAALSTVCTHLGCTPNWLEAEQKFKCPCHGSGFYINGINFEGPAPRPLERYAIRIAEDGQLEVDKSRKFQEEKGQWEDPDSFVPA